MRFVWLACVGLCLGLCLAHAQNTTEKNEQLSKLVKEVSIVEGPIHQLANSEKCPEKFHGPNCEIPKCFNGAAFSEKYKKCACPPKFFGTHCHTPLCKFGELNDAQDGCNCPDNLYGVFCEIECVNGMWNEEEQICECERGFAPPSCKDCMSGSSVCPHSRPTYRSRFALAAATLSFVTVIMIWMSIVVRRRRRSLLSTLNRERIAVVGCSGASNRLAAPETPPGAPYPLYYPPVHENLTAFLPPGPPPSYEEALRTGRPVMPKNEDT